VRLGVEALLGRVDGRITGEPRLMMAGVTLRTRGTTAPARADGAAGNSVGPERENWNLAIRPAGTYIPGDVSSTLAHRARSGKEVPET
jgi:hypothetical protein